MLPSGKLTQLWKITIFNGKTHYKWSFSIATLNYQRVPEQFTGTPSCVSQDVVVRNTFLEESGELLSRCFPAKEMFDSNQFSSIIINDYQ
jgi:hypothetical protein